MKLPRLHIRADASEAIGHGHVLRCLALAQAWRAAGGDAVFYSYRLPDPVSRRLRAERFQQRPVRAPLSTEWAPRSGWIVLDGYRFGPAYQAALRRRGPRVLQLADAPLWSRYHADLILDQNEGSQWSSYLLPQGALLAGVRYALLRREYQRRRPAPVRARARRVLVIAGGSDRSDLLGRAIAELGRVRRPLEVCLVVGSSNPRSGRLAALALSSPHRVQLVHSPADLVPWIRWADIALSAAGVTALELACLGTPSILTAVADNQEAVSRAFRESGAALVLPRLSRLPRGGLAAAVARLIGDPVLRRRLSRAGRRFIDTQGAARVVRLMAAITRPGPLPARVRLARHEDSAAVWRLSNHPSARAVSLSKELIPPDTHRRWYDAKLRSKATRIYLLDLGGTVIGQTRYDLREPGLAEVSVSVASAFRGRGVGTRLLRATFRPACRALRARRVRARILPGNEASVRIFEKAGYRLGSTTRCTGRPCYEYFRCL